MTDVIGMRFLNNSRVVQVDQNRVVLQLRKKGTVTTGSDGDAGHPWIATVTYTGADEFPLLAFKPGAVDATIVGRSRSGNTVTWLIGATGQMSVDYYVFDRPVMPAGNGSFLRDPATGKLMFSSAAPPLKVAQMIDWSGADLNLTVPSGKAFAITMSGEALTRVSEHESTSSNPPTFSEDYVSWLNYTVYKSGSVIHSHHENEVYFAYGSGTGPGDGYGLSDANSGLQRLMVIDVTMCDRFSF